MPLILSTCWYVFKAKFNKNVYARWIYNMLSNVNNYYLVIYTDENSRHYEENHMLTYKSRILVVIKPIERILWIYRYQSKCI
jgi:hypothetical protein